jgi:hypothetical protein
MTTDTYTLAEAERELKRRACARIGHSMDFGPRLLKDEVPATVLCTRCGWTGTVTMGARP